MAGEGNLQKAERKDEEEWKCKTGWIQTEKLCKVNVWLEADGGKHPGTDRQVKRQGKRWGDVEEEENGSRKVRWQARWNEWRGRRITWRWLFFQVHHLVQGNQEDGLPGSHGTRQSPGQGTPTQLLHRLHGQPSVQWSHRRLQARTSDESNPPAAPVDEKREDHPVRVGWRTLANKLFPGPLQNDFVRGE